MQKTTQHSISHRSRNKSGPTTARLKPTKRSKKHHTIKSPPHSTSSRHQATQKQSQQSPQKAQPPAYLNINITPWPLDTQLSENAKSALVGDATIFFRSMFGDTLPPKAHFCGEISFPYNIKHNNSSGSGNVSKKGEVNPMYMGLSQVLCESLLHQNYLPQASLDSLMNPQSSPTSQSKSKSHQPHLVHSSNNKNNEIDLDHPIAKDILAIYSEHFNPDSISDDLSDLTPTSTLTSPTSSTQSPKIPIPAYILQGSYHNVKLLSSTLKTFLIQKYSLSPPFLSKIFNIPLDTLKHHPALVEFLQTRHISLLSSYLLGRLVVSLDSNYTPIHLIDLPHFANNHTINPNTQQDTYQTTNNNHPLPLDSSDAIANVLERQSSSLIPLSFLPRQRYGVKNNTNYDHLRATNSITAIKIHHGFAQPPKPHPNNPKQTAKTLAPLPTTLQHIQLGYLLPLPLFTSMLASQSSITFTIPSAATVISRTFDTELSPSYSQYYQNNSTMMGSNNNQSRNPFHLSNQQQQPQQRQLYGGFNNFVPTRTDYLDLFQSHFIKWSTQWLTSRSRFPQLNILDMGCGTGVLSVTAQDLFHHLSTVTPDMYLDSTNSSSKLRNGIDSTLLFDSSNHINGGNGLHSDQLKQFIQSKRPQPFRLNITSCDVNPRAVTTSQRNQELILHYHENEPNPEYVNGDVFEDLEDDLGSFTHTYQNNKKLKTPLKLNSKKGSQYFYSIKSQSVQSDLFYNLPHPEPEPSLLVKDAVALSTLVSKSFYDLIVFNPPWLPLPQRSQGSSDRAIFDNQFETLTRFLKESKSHLRSAQPFYQYLYRKVKPNGEMGEQMDNQYDHHTESSPSFGIDNKGDITIDVGQLDSEGQGEEDDIPMESNSNNGKFQQQKSPNLNKNLMTETSSFALSAKLLKHQHIYEYQTSEVWIIISDLFQRLGLDDTINHNSNNTNNNHNNHHDKQFFSSQTNKTHPFSSKSSQYSQINPASRHFHGLYPAQSKFISYLEQTSGLVLVDIADGQSHNHQSFSPHSGHDLASIRGQERILIYVLRDIGKM